MRLPYHIDMNVPRQQSDPAPLKGARARTRKLMLTTARHMMQDGLSPSVSEVAEAAEVSRSTAYRYFPTKEAMVRAVVGETLGPILEWRSELTAADARVSDLIRFSFPRIVRNEATFKAALRVELEAGAAGSQADDNAPIRGHRMELIGRALEGVPPSVEKERLSQVLAVLFGVEALTVLNDICGLDGAQAEDVVVWAAEALTRVTLEDT
ncbi:TetR/AcrR family transcriptional regulator [Shimia abyssi]|uniref:TetR family transcriptional regulator n=1 Tax=Shimia abyssi TaxID=1662395 RepID=A0A2P8FCE8_9RHOB|nr:TetR/AcrR family transcriptional regulator [Shimia abyssi]PSL19362.1 TetR family transcriptional regulator [Shimia abyssi]